MWCRRVLPQLVLRIDPASPVHLQLEATAGRLFSPSWPALEGQLAAALKAALGSSGYWGRFHSMWLQDPLNPPHLQVYLLCRIPLAVCDFGECLPVCTVSQVTCPPALLLSANVKTANDMHASSQRR
jgi:hypothetical protein